MSARAQAVQGTDRVGADPADLPQPPDLAALTGVRSGKQTYYSAYQRSNERLQQIGRAHV